MSYANDPRTVLSLDAGGTNFVFTAIRAGEEVVNPVSLPSHGDNLELCLDTLISGFRQILSQLADKPSAISFAFPGPADYPNGIIGDLGNLPGFRGGVALGPMLEEVFGMPVFINNDGDLYAYGEAIAGYLPYINGLLEQAGSPRRFNNLVGFTLGTGFGAGIARNGDVHLGDNSGAAEVWLLSSRYLDHANVEEGVSIRAVRRVYADLTGMSTADAPTPKEINDIANGLLPGNREAALQAYRHLGKVLGDVLCNVMTLTDSIAVIGGGIAGAYTLIKEAMFEEMRSSFRNFSGNAYPRLVQKVFDLEDQAELGLFLKGDSREIMVPLSGRKLIYDPLSRLGVGTSKIGTSRAISIGAYAFALKRLDD